VSNITPSELEALGLYDPAEPDAAERLELLEYLVELGATTDDLVTYKDELPGLASIIVLRGPVMSLREAAERSGLPEEKIRRITRAAGFADPNPDDRVFGVGFADLAAGIAAAEGLFGEDAVIQLTRVMGSAMARLADAAVSAFLVNVEPEARRDDPVGLNVARANAEAAGLVPVIIQTLNVMLRQHLVAARRTILGDWEAAYEMRPLLVGFVDLVGSTALSQQLSTAELGAVLGEFESVAAETVTGGGGRVVKLIGDEILYTAGDERSACAIALELASAFSDHPRIPAVRAGVAGGEVLMRDGDVFGPVVNLAARAVKVAGPSEVVAPPAVAEAAGLEVEPLGPQSLKGFDAGVELCRLVT
jgi:adenylate cyclase